VVTSGHVTKMAVTPTTLDQPYPKTYAKRKPFKSYRLTDIHTYIQRDRHRDNLWSRDKDGNHTIQCTVVKNPMLHLNLMALSFIELELRARVTKVHFAEASWTFSAPVTLTLIR